MYKALIYLRFDKKDKNIIYNPIDSKLVTLIEQRQIDCLSLIMHFYGYDGDGLVGYVKDK
jgi:hypothetical protein